MPRFASQSLIALLLLGLSVVRQDDPAPEYGKDIFGRDVPLQGDPYLRLQGLWQLVDIDDPDLPRPSREHEGYMLIHGRSLALELHVQWSDARYRGVLFFARGRWHPADVFQTGIHQFQLDRLGNMRTTALIGSYLDEEDRLLWEDAGTVHEYRVEVFDNSLSLMLPDGGRYDFARHRSPSDSQLDFYGGPSAGDRDIFGRRVREQPEGTDIFGRDRSGATPDIFGREGQGKVNAGGSGGEQSGGDPDDDGDGSR